MIHRFAFHGGAQGPWHVTSIAAVRGEGLASVAALDVRPAIDDTRTDDSAWVLQGLISHVRYANRREIDGLKAQQEGLGRAAARRAALIPIRKTADWWALAQDERRAIFEETSNHTAIGMAYLPAVARQLYHARDLAEPFDFLTWFEYAPEHSDAFEELVQRLRATREWAFVEREVDIRLERPTHSA